MPRLQPNIALCILGLMLVTQTGYCATLSLDDCLKLAKERNPLLQTVRWDQSVANQQVRQSDSSLYPRVDLQGGYTAQLEPQAMKINGMTMETQQGSYGFANLAATQTIYDFGRRDARRKQAQSANKAVESGIRSKEQEVSLQVIEAYFAVLEAEKQVITTQQELQTVTEHRRVARTLYDNGVVTRNDLLQADLRSASTRQKLLSIQNMVTNLRLQLNFLIGGEPGQQPELLEPSEAPAATIPTTDTAKALALRPDLHALRKQLEVNDQELRESKTLFYPEIFARASMDYLQNDKMREQAIYAGTIGLKINLFDGFSSTASREKSVSTRSRTQQQLQMAEQQARLEIAMAQNDTKVARERIAVTVEAIKQGEENLRINQNRYQERVGTATDVLDAQTLLSQSRTEHYRAYYDYQISSARLRKAVGEL
ncbi:Outer membrane protein TolC [Trichlorobacter thiogenes]|uniref:Outer membrane protein TolC n=1 Tax=Trichlorobacter thiogenes TaxID=115783 RepID=A0A1T4RN02_9BACT|nr:TolC family protein [Trichlorobacter thiogenes]SKA17385.1 Outer membrane protein TolC [Trichlorobacter thiogenes]